MKNDKRLHRLIEGVAAKPGIPHTLNQDIVRLAQRHLKATGRSFHPQQRDVTWAVDQAWREWSRRFLSALEARIAESGDVPSGQPA